LTRCRHDTADPSGHDSLARSSSVSVACDLPAIDKCRCASRHTTTTADPVPHNYLIASWKFAGMQEQEMAHPVLCSKVLECFYLAYHWAVAASANQPRAPTSSTSRLTDPGCRGIPLCSRTSIHRSGIRPASVRRPSGLSVASSKDEDEAHARHLTPI
jgi:hypothetical protein